MGSFEEIVQEALRFFQAEETLNDVRFVSAYPSAYKPAPIRRPMGVVGLRSVALEDGALGAYVGRRDGTPLYGRRARVELAIVLYLPRDRGGAGCEEVFSRLCDSALSGGLEGALGLTGGAARWEESAGAFAMDCTLRLGLYLGREEEGKSMDSLVVKGVGL